MKNMKRLASVLLALVMILSMAPALASGDVTGTPATGSITINSSDTVAVAGKTFNAYKILDLKLDASNTAHAYTVPAAMKSFYKTYFTLDTSKATFDADVIAKIEALKDNKDGLFAFAAAALTAAKTAGVTPGTAAAQADAESVTISNLELGYYVVAEADNNEAPISALILDSTNPNATVTIKADQPSVDKKIVEGENKVENNNVAVGDTVNFEITSKVPDMTGYTKYYYVLNDTLSKGLTYTADSMTVKVGEKSLVKDTDYTLTVGEYDEVNGTAIKIVFKNFIQYKSQEDAAIVVTYAATLNENAVIGVAGNPNKVALTYSNNPNIDDKNTTDEPTKDSPVGTTPEEITRTFVTGLELIKVDPNKNRLTGAEFEITGEKLNKVIVRKSEFVEAADGTYWALKDGTYTEQDPATEGMDTSKYADTSKKYKKTAKGEVISTNETVKAIATVDANGVLRFDGLSAGEYVIKEIKAPDGYNLLTDPINVTISWTAPTTGENDCTWSFSENVVDKKDYGELTIENNTGSELPETGGIGTTIFYVVGGLLMAAAVVLLVTKKKMSVSND